MTVKQIVESVNACLADMNSCSSCAFYECDRRRSCQTLLAEAVANKFNELVNLLDDKVNHHYYDTLDTLQNDNEELRTAFEKIVKIATKQIDK